MNCWPGCIAKAIEPAIGAGTWVECLSYEVVEEGPLWRVQLLSSGRGIDCKNFSSPPAWWPPGTYGHCLDLYLRPLRGDDMPPAVDMATDIREDLLARIASFVGPL